MKPIIEDFLIRKCRGCNKCVLSVKEYMNGIYVSCRNEKNCDDLKKVNRKNG